MGNTGHQLTDELCADWSVQTSCVQHENCMWSSGGCVPAADSSNAVSDTSPHPEGSTGGTPPPGISLNELILPENLPGTALVALGSRRNLQKDKSKLRKSGNVLLRKL